MGGGQGAVTLLEDIHSYQSDQYFLAEQHAFRDARWGNSFQEKEKAKAVHGLSINSDLRFVF